MADIQSKGTFGLSHFRNSRAAMEMYEPLYKNIFTIQFVLPAGVGSDTENTNLVLENVTKISGLDSHRYPDASATQSYKYAQRRFIGAKPEKTTMDVAIDFEVNLQPKGGNTSAYVVKTLRKWCDLAFDPQTGRTGLKADYTAPWMLITAYNRAAQPYWQWKCYNVFPMTPITPMELDYNSTDLYKVEGFTLAVDYFDESII